ncbi:anthranilate synthase component I [bacterium]|nr:anthranilate synthase component I [bacterium]
MKSFSLSKMAFTHHKMGFSGCPVVVFEKLYPEAPFAFLYESLESFEKRGRYSFIGAKPFLIFKSHGEHIQIIYGHVTMNDEGNPFEMLRQLVQNGQPCPHVVPFSGGAVGYAGYDAIRFVESIPDSNPDELNIPDLFFMFPSELVVFDHLEQTADIILYSETEIDYNRLEVIKKEVERCRDKRLKDDFQTKPDSVSMSSNFSREAFCSIVDQAKEYILAGDIFQVVLSQRFSFDIPTDSMSIYKALRKTNPSPYMYYLVLNDLNILGSSPEILVKLSGDQVSIRPLAGTRRRGKSDREDQQLADELLSDEKERAEHVMLVDLARNDIGRVCQYGSVQATHLFEIEKYSKVMHLVSDVTGILEKNKDAFDLFQATFPAGTVSGAPKVRSMEIIDELENVRRGVYAGAIGYFGYSGDMDMCIAIRMILIRGDKGYIQAGAGIVADSIPDREYQETYNKARALIHALDMEGGK